MDRDGGGHRHGRAEADVSPTSGDGLTSAFESLEDSSESTRERIHESDAGTALVVSCSMDGCEYSRAQWPVEPSWNVVGVPTLGNQAWELYEDEKTLDGALAHLTTEHDVTAVLVVGHTTCDVVADAYEQYLAPATERPAGIEARLDPLASLVGDAFDEEVLEESTPRRTARYRLVEYNVVRQVGFLHRTLPEATTPVGCVHDQDGAYSSFPDKRHVVAVDGESSSAEIRARLPDDASASVASLL